MSNIRLTRHEGHSVELRPHFLGYRDLVVDILALASPKTQFLRMGNHLRDVIGVERVHNVEEIRS